MVFIVCELYLKKAVFFFFFKVAWQELIHSKLGIFFNAKDIYSRDETNGMSYSENLASSLCSRCHIYYSFLNFFSFK